MSILTIFFMSLSFLSQDFFTFNIIIFEKKQNIKKKKKPGTLNKNKNLPGYH